MNHVEKLPFLFSFSSSFVSFFLTRLQAPTDLGLLNHKGWGMAADFQVWWACASNLLSGIHGEMDQRVVISHACWPAVGFTVRDRPKFIKHVEALVGAPLAM